MREIYQPKSGGADLEERRSSGVFEQPILLGGRRLERAIAGRESLLLFFFFFEFFLASSEISEISS